MFRYHNKNLPSNFDSYFVNNNKIHHHYTRNANKLHKSYVRTNILKYTIRIKGIDIWNDLDMKIRNIQSYYKN